MFFVNYFFLMELKQVKGSIKLYNLRKLSFDPFDMLVGHGFGKEIIFDENYD